MNRQFAHSTLFRRLLATLLVVVSVVVIAPWAVRAADPAFVGVIAFAADDEGANRLGLSDEVREKLKKLIDERENAAINLALSIKELPPEERKRRLEPFVAESEKLGMELLTPEQRSKLNQLRVQRAGMTTLAEPEFAKSLALTAEQQGAVQRLLAERSGALTRGGATEQRLTRAKYERLLRSILTKQQRALWEQRAGLGPGPSVAEMAAKPETESTGEPAVMKPNPDADAESAASPSDAGDPKPEPNADTDRKPIDPNNVRLRFSFRSQPWQDVLDWLAEEADLSLQSDIIPEGTFNYSDTRTYTPTEAIDVINGVLLSQGYTLVRRGRLLTIINLEEPVPDVLVEYVPVDKLDERGRFELIKTVFQLKSMDPADAEQEIGQLLGPGRTMVVMPKARQILVTETADKLRTIRDVIERAENPDGASDTGMTEFELTHVSPEEVLMIARTLLGLEEDQNVGEDISIALDPLGTRIFVTGSKEKVETLADLIKRVDTEKAATAGGAALEQPQLRTHPIHVADPEKALAVLQTLLAGLPDVRLEIDATTKKVIALARPSEHKTIEDTIKQLEGDEPIFEVIQLRKLDPQMAVLTIGNFLNDGEEEGGSAIKIDADPITRKLFVWATKDDIAKIKSVIEKLEGPAEGGTGGTLRFIPMTGNSALSAVETAKRLWTGKNRIELRAPSAGGGPTLFDLKEISPDRQTPSRGTGTPAPSLPPNVSSPPPAARPTGAPGQRPNKPIRSAKDKITRAPGDRRVARQVPIRFVAFHPDEPSRDDESASPESVAPQQKPSATGSDIRIEFTPNGVVIASEDTEALDRFEEILRLVMPQQSPLSPGKNFTVYFLKNCKADVARQLISDILGGTGGDSSGGSLLGDVASTMMGGGGILGALMGGGGSGGDGATTIQATGPVSIVADSRLNCLIVQGLPVDIDLVEQLLKVIDREGSITDIQTAGRPYVIPVSFAPAEEVANVVKEAYANRIATTTTQRGGQPNPAELIRALRGGRGGRSSTDVKSQEPKMTIAVDTRSNSIIVTAPEQLYVEVRQLIEEIDHSCRDLAQEYVVVSLKNANPDAVQRALSSLMGTASSSRSSSSRPSGPSTARPPTAGSRGAPSSGDFQRRMEAFQRMRSMMGGGRPPVSGAQPRGIAPARPSSRPTARGGSSRSSSPRGRSRGR